MLQLQFCRVTIVCTNVFLHQAWSKPQQIILLKYLKQMLAIIKNVADNNFDCQPIPIIIIYYTRR